MTSKPKNASSPMPAKKLLKRMRQTSATTREMLAVFTFCRQFKHYLPYKKFVVRTDHKALTWLETIKDVDRMAARWHEELQQYDFEI